MSSTIFRYCHLLDVFSLVFNDFFGDFGLNLIAQVSGAYRVRVAFLEMRLHDLDGITIHKDPRCVRKRLRKGLNMMSTNRLEFVKEKLRTFHTRRPTHHIKYILYQLLMQVLVATTDPITGLQRREGRWRFSVDTGMKGRETCQEIGRECRPASRFMKDDSTRRNRETWQCAILNGGIVLMGSASDVIKICFQKGSLTHFTLAL